MTAGEKAKLIREVMARFNAVRPAPGRGARYVGKEWNRSRRKAMREIREKTGWSYPSIARLFGVTHVTVMYACDEEFRQKRLAAANEQYAKAAGD